jgi:calcyclin binding protein
MDMMKDMYEDGDENMRKVIGEAMLKSQRGEKPEPPSMDDL